MVGFNSKRWDLVKNKQSLKRVNLRRKVREEAALLRYTKFRAVYEVAWNGLKSFELFGV